MKAGFFEPFTSLFDVALNPCIVAGGEEDDDDEEDDPDDTADALYHTEVRRTWLQTWQQ